MPAVRPGRRPRAAQAGGLRRPAPTSARSRSSPTARGYDQGIVTMLEQNLGVDHRLRDDGLRDLPGAAGLRPAADVEHLVGRGLPGAQRLPGRAAGHGLDRQPGRLVVARVRRRDRRRDVRRRPRGGDRGLRRRPWRSSATRRRRCPVSYGTSFSLVRDGLLGASQNGLGILRLAGPGVGGRPVTRLRRGGRGASRSWLAPSARPRAGAVELPLAADEVSFGKPDAVADYGNSITFTVDVTPTGAARARRAPAAAPGHDRPADRRRAGRRRAPGPTRCSTARRHRRRPHRPQHADHGDLGGLHGAGRRAGRQPLGPHPVPGHDARTGGRSRAT